MIFKLAISSLKFEKILNFCLIASLCSVIAPLLLLFSLRFGIVNNLETKLKSNPTNLEIKFSSGYKLEESFFKELENDPHVSFVIPLTRALSVSADLFANGKRVTGVDALPTKENDPLVLASIGTQNQNLDQNQNTNQKINKNLNPKNHQTLNLDEAYISETLAQDLKLKEGDTFKFIISRKLNGNNENSVKTFKLKGIIKKEFLPLKNILINFKTLVFMEDYRDGFNPEFFSDGLNPNTNRTHFAKARLYVKSLEDVESISKKLRENYNISDKLAQIENLKAITKVLNFIFLAIAVTSIIGGIFATFGLIYTNLSRQRKSIALLKLTGISNFKIMLKVIIENLIIAILAYLLSLGIFYLGMEVFNSYFKDLLGANTLVSTLTLSHIFIGLLLTIFINLLISILLSKIKINKVHVAQSLRII